MVGIHMQDGKGRMPKDLLYGDLTDVHVKLTAHSFASTIFSRDMKFAATKIEGWELMVEDRSTWRHLVKEEIKHAKNTRNMRQVEKRNIRKAMGTVALPNTIFKFEKDCRSFKSPEMLFNKSRRKPVVLRDWRRPTTTNN